MNPNKIAENETQASFLSVNPELTEWLAAKTLRILQRVVDRKQIVNVCCVAAWKNTCSGKSAHVHKYAPVSIFSRFILVKTVFGLVFPLISAKILFRGEK